MVAIPGRVPVMIVGAGPTGLMLAAELGLRGTDCLVIERLAEPPPVSRSLVIHARTLEYLDMRDLLEEFLARGHPYNSYPVGTSRARVRFAGLGLTHTAVLALPQHVTESVLEGRVAALGTTVVRGASLTGLRQTDGGVTASVQMGGSLHTVRADIVVGCDGARSTVREQIGVGFPGRAYPDYVITGDVRLDGPTDDQPWASFFRHGMVILLPFGDGRWRVIVYDYGPTRRASGAMSLERMRATLLRIAGTDFHLHDPSWLSRYRCDQRHARTYRVGRILLAGDAAHVHAPTGGQGMNTGLGDAMNLGWKLSRVIQDPVSSLLDTYERERRRANARVLAGTGALLRFNTARTPPARTLRWLLLHAALPTRTAQRFLSGRLSGLAIAYHDVTNREPAGGRMPDLAVCAPSRTARLFEVLRGGDFVLVTRDAAVARAAARPGLVAVSTASLEWPAVLVRPDGYVAWAARSDTPVDAKWLGDRLDDTL